MTETTRSPPLAPRPRRFSDGFNTRSVTSTTGDLLESLLEIYNKSPSKVRLNSHKKETPAVANMLEMDDSGYVSDEVMGGVESHHPLNLGLEKATKNITKSKTEEPKAAKASYKDKKASKSSQHQADVVPSQQDKFVRCSNKIQDDEEAFWGFASLKI